VSVHWLRLLGDKMNIFEILEEPNVANLLDDETLVKIGAGVIESYERDKGSRANWETKNKEALRMASQFQEKKNNPWEDSSNVKYPLITTSAMQFQSRAAQALLKGTRPVFGKVIGEDPDGSKKSRGERISAHMSYQVLHEMKEWQDDMDRLLMVLAVIGTCFKKSYFSPTKLRNVSDLVLPQDLVISYYASNFDKARKTHRLYLDHNELIEYQRKEIYRNVDLGVPMGFGDDDERMEEEKERLGMSSGDVAGSMEEGPNSYDIPHEILEQHYVWDLDGDGYAEPYIVTVDRTTQHVLRIVPRFDEEAIEHDGTQVVRIEPIEFFTRFVFLPDFTSSIYGIGFGSLIGSTNAAVNTVLNQLIDAGTLSTLQAGFLSRGIRFPKGGAVRFRPGEWKVVASTGDDLRKGVFPLPTREPSGTLFQLLGLLIQAGEEIGSVAEVMKGQNPGQNQPFSTTSALLEQGLQVFVTIYKRTYRSLGEEFKKLFDLNRIYMEDAAYVNVLDDPRMSDQKGPQGITVTQRDYNEKDIDVIPAADPDVVSQTQRLLKAESLGQKLQLGLPINPAVATRKWLEAEGQEDIPELMEMPPPQPDFETQLEMDKFAHQQSMDQLNLMLEMRRLETEQIKDKAQAMAHVARAEGMADATRIEQMKVILESIDRSERIDSELEREAMKLVSQQVVESMKRDQAKALARKSSE
jgi:chaperonin GroES